MTTRGVIYLSPERSGAYLAKENKPDSGKEKVLVEKALKEARELLRMVPDGNRILGGFCTDPTIARKIADLQDVAPQCRKKLKRYQNKSNFHSTLFWSFFGATGATGLGMALGGFLGSPGEVRAGLVIGFGSAMVALALTTTIGPFARISSRQKTLGQRLDNYMWTLRRRVTAEVCTAPNRATAAYRLAQIHRTLHTMCTSNKPDDGLYTIPNQ